MKGTTLASFQAETLDGVWWREWAFLGGHGLCPRPPRSPSGWTGSLGVLVCGPPAQQGVGSTPGSGTLSSAKRANCLGTPLGPCEVAAHTPFPSLPCLQNRSGVSCLFTFHKSVGLDCPLPAPWRHSGTLDFLSPAPPPRFLAVLAFVSHAPPKLFLALLASFPYSSPRPPPPKALSCLELKALARDLKGQYLERQLSPFGAFLMWTLRPAPPQATPQHKCPGDTRPRGQCTPYCCEGGSPKPRKEAWMFWTEQSPDLFQQWDMQECVLSQRDRAQRAGGGGQGGGRGRNQEARADKEGGRLPETTWGMDYETHFSFHCEQGEKSELKRNGQTTTAHTPTVLGSVFFGHPGF